MPAAMLVDSHCHLDFEQLSADLPAVLTRADQAGVGMMLSISTRLSTFPNVRAIAEAHDHIYCTVGIHPLEAANEGPTTAVQLGMYAEHPKVIGFGESGLDYHYDTSPPKDIQHQQFLEHIIAARENDLPLVIHARDADEDMMQILCDETAKGPFKFILHCFSSGRELAETGVELGGYVSFSGILTYKKSDALRAIAADIPLNRLLVETDAPYLAPQPVRGQTCEPGFVAYTAETLANLKGVSYEELCEQTTANFLELFQKVAV